MVNYVMVLSCPHTGKVHNKDGINVGNLN